MSELSVIFLDVDGVLNYIDCDDEFSQSSLIWLAELVKYTNSKIIVSSAYKLHEESMQRLWDKLEEYGIDRLHHSISDYSCTPDLIDGNKTRVDEIMYVVNSLSLTNWLAIDDYNLSDNGNNLLDHFIQTDAKKGLTHENVIESIKLLNIKSYS